jgi:hypothetical protein
LANCPILGAQAQLYAAQGRHQDVIATMTKVQASCLLLAA